MNPTGTDNRTDISLSRAVSIVLADRDQQPQVIKADSKGKLPTKIELLKVGMWRTPYHGDIMVTPDDLLEYVANFDAGIGYTKAAGLPIDYKHEDWDKAAGWIKKLYIEGETLMGEVEWTPNGAKALMDGEFKLFSPMFYPKGRGGWMDPQDYEHIVENLITGGGLTNIPLFPELKPIMASAYAKDKTNVFFVSASQEVKEITMDLATIRGKGNDELTDAEKDHLATHKEELTAEEQAKFGFEVTAKKDDDTPTPAADPNKDKNPEDEEVEVTDKNEAAVAASLEKRGFAVVKADRLERLEKTATAYERERAEGIVKAHVKRGAIKADQLGPMTDRLMKDASFEDVLKGMNGDEAVAASIGSDTAAGDAADNEDKLRARAAEIKASAYNKDKKVMSFSDAYNEAKKEQENK